ncbi:MAG: lytic transglycosylase domain-containing protein [Lysobacterales bacterium]
MKHPLSILLLILGLFSMCDAVDAMDIPPAYRRVADEYGIPPQVLYAVALTESGLRMPGSRDHRPWPWTLNVAGKSYRYGTRNEAYVGLMQHLERTDLVDVGLMQVNWRYHGQKLLDQNLSLDPWFNLRVGASILRELFDDCGDWMTAAGRYHAPANPERAAGYAARVRRHLAAVERGDARVH